MIRALVSTMYKHAGHRHMCEIFKNVRSLLAYYTPWKTLKYFQCLAIIVKPILTKYFELLHGPFV